MAKKNIELLKRLRTRFLRMRHRKHFNMKVLAKATECGTAMCIAGHTLDLAGYKMRKKSEIRPRNEGDFGRLDFDYISPAGEVVRHPLRAAAKELGMEYSFMSEARNLFHDWSLHTPKQAARRIAEIIEEAST